MEPAFSATTSLGVTSLAGALLGLLQEQPMSGYDLRKLFAATPLRHFSTSPGAIYPALRRLQNAGLIEGMLDRSTPLRPREVFCPTTAGLAALEEHLSTPPSRSEVCDHLDLIFLRFVFMPGVLGVARTLDFLQLLAVEIRGYLAELEAFQKEHAKEMPIGPRLALMHGIETYNLHLSWCRRAMAALKRQGRAS